MTIVFAFTALYLFGTLPLHAADPPAGKPTAPVLSGLARLRPAMHEPMPGWNTGGLPRWQVQLGGRTYFLVFDGKTDLQTLVEKNRYVWWWKVRGRAEYRTFTLGRQPARPGDPVLQDARVVTLNVLVVESLEPSLLEAFRRAESVRVTVCTEIKWFGNSHSRMPDGTIMSTCKLCLWEGCYIEMEGRRVRVIGLPGDIAEQYGYRGQVFTLVGRLEQRAEGPRVPPDVLVVESFQRG
jgi:hypothetical protein